MVHLLVSWKQTERNKRVVQVVVLVRENQWGIHTVRRRKSLRSAMKIRPLGHVDSGRQ